MTISVINTATREQCLPFDKEQLLRVIFYHMDHTVHDLLKREVPASYSRYLRQWEPS